MKVRLTLAAMKRRTWIVCGVMALSASGTPSFRAAKPIWADGGPRGRRSRSPRVIRRKAVAALPVVAGGVPGDGLQAQPEV